MTERPRRSMLAAPLLVTLAIWAPVDAGAQAGPTCRGEPATIVADEGFVRGTGGDDVIVATKRNGNVEGRGGDDLICLQGDSFHEAYGDGGADRIYGSPGGDNLYGGAGDDLVEGGRGRDLISDFDRRGNDRYVGGPDPDVLRFSAEFTRGAAGGVIVDLAVGRARGRGSDRLEGIDSVIGTLDRDVIVGTPGANILDGVRGGDRILGAQGDDVIRGATRVFGEGGGSGDPPGDDRILAGGKGDDRILGLVGDDRLSGGEGDDHLAGGEGRDRATGGSGRDRCVTIEQARGCE